MIVTETAVRTWETATLVFTTVTVALTGFSSLFAYFHKRPPSSARVKRVSALVTRDFELFSLQLAQLATAAAIAGMVSSFAYTLANRKLQNEAESEQIKLHNQLAVTSRQSAEASEKAQQAYTDLTDTKKELNTTINELADSKRELADAKERLIQVESRTKWRTLTPLQRRLMAQKLSFFKGQFIALNPIAGDNEVHYFATDIMGVFKKAGWKVGWTDFLELTSSGDISEAGKRSEGVRLEIPEFVKTAPQYGELHRELIATIRIADPQATIRYLNGNNPEDKSLHIVVGQRRPPSSH